MTLNYQKYRAAMCQFIENRPPQSYYWDRDALVHLQSNLHRSRAEFSQLLNSEAEHPAFDPFTVRNLIREARGSGHTPTDLLLGKIEFASFRHFIRRGFGEESGSPERSHYFMGLLVHEDASPSRLELGSSKLLLGGRA
jgi:hypothetical protein